MCILESLSIRRLVIYYLFQLLAHFKEGNFLWPNGNGLTSLGVPACIGTVVPHNKAAKTPYLNSLSGKQSIRHGVEYCIYDLFSLLFCKVFLFGQGNYEFGLVHTSSKCLLFLCYYNHAS